MTPATVNFTMYRGSSFNKGITVLDADSVAFDLTGWTAYAQVRLAPGRPVIVDLEPVIEVPATGRIDIAFTDEQTDLFPHGEFVWDLLLESPEGAVDGPYLAGSFTILAPVTNLP